MKPERSVRLAGFTSLKVGGPADFFWLAGSGREMAEGLRWARDNGVPVRVIGGGSNLLVAEAGVDSVTATIAVDRLGTVEACDTTGGRLFYVGLNTWISADVAPVPCPGS